MKKVPEKVKDGWFTRDEFEKGKVVQVNFGVPVGVKEYEMYAFAEVDDSGKGRILLADKNRKCQGALVMLDYGELQRESAGVCDPREYLESE